MPSIPITFQNGIFSPAKIATKILKPTPQGFASYAQNIDVQSDEYGNGIAVPGPGLVQVTNNDDLTGFPIFRSDIGGGSVASNWFYFVQRVIATGVTDTVRRVELIGAGLTPQIDDAASEAVDHSAHSSEEITDMVYRDDGAKEVFICGLDATDGWVLKHTASTDTIAFSTVTALSNFTLTNEPKMFVASDNKIYVVHGDHVDSIDAADAYTANETRLPLGLGATDVNEYELFLAVAYSTEADYTFDNVRKGGGRSGIMLWELGTASGVDRLVPCPSRYISAMMRHPSGAFLVFGGIDEGKCTLYEFTGFKFRPIFSYIGELPRSRHSVDFDGQGRILWQTADGQVLRYNFETGTFEHLTNTDGTTQGEGGLLVRAVGGTGNEFLVGSGVDGSPDTFSLDIVRFGTYIGDADGADDVDTPEVISGLQAIPPGSSITNIEVRLQKALVSGDKLSIRLYIDGSTTATEVGTIEFANEGAITTWRKEINVPAENFALGIAWKMADANATAPGVVNAVVTYKEGDLNY